jgi:hypothetical protein
MGNQARLRLLTGQASGAATAAPGFFQPKLTIGAVEDPLEREADRVADHVMGMGQARPTAETAPPQISRKCAACDEEARTVQRKSAEGAGVAGGEAPSIVDEVVRSPGQPLDASARAFFEPRFGRDFSNVQIHSEAQASASARAVGARAYTAGNHVVFSQGEYAPHTASGRLLLAHELAHVVQQSGADMSLQREVGDEPQDPVALQTGGAGAGVDLRTDSSCDNPRALPIGETFVPNTTATLYSLPFHAPTGTTINIGLDAELETSGTPSLATVGVDVFQCCSLSDTRITTSQTIGTVGQAGHPAHTPLSVNLRDACVMSSNFGSEFIYYLRLRIASTLQAVRISYSVR